MPQIPQTLAEKLTTRNFIAISMTITLIVVIMQMTFNAQVMIVTLKENTEWVVTGAIVFGVFLAKFSDIIQFFFRRSVPK